MIYFIEAMIYPEDSDNRYFNLYKIGFTRNPEQRLRRLQLLSPVSLVLRGYMPGEREQEAAIHRRLASSRSHGEWFRADENVTEFMQDNSTWMNKPLLKPRSQ